MPGSLSPPSRPLPPPPLPLAVRNGHIKRITDQDIQSSVLEIMSANVSTTFVSCPADPAQTLGIRLPFLVRPAGPPPTTTLHPAVATKQRQHVSPPARPGPHPEQVMIIKNLKKYFSFEVQVLDDKNVRRRFRASNYQVRKTPLEPD